VGGVVHPVPLTVQAGAMGNGEEAELKMTGQGGGEGPVAMPR